MGWGIVYPPYSVINMGVVQPPTPTKRWVYNFNGVNTHIDTGGYTYSGDFWIEVKAQLPTQLPAGNQAFFGGSGGGSPNPGAFTAFLNPSQGFISVQIPTTSGIRYDLSTPVATYIGATITLRLERSAGIWSMLINGTVVDTFDSNSFGVVDMQVTSIARWSATIYYNGAVYDYKDSLGNNLPINDRTFGPGAVIANTGTGPDATGVNLLESGWTEINT